MSVEAAFAIFFLLVAIVLYLMDDSRGAIRCAVILLGIVGFWWCNHLHAFSWNYAGNGLIEFVGSLFLLENVFKLHADKMLRGYSWKACAFFMSWGYWNIYYYPSVGDWWSFTGGLFVVAVNTFWLGQMIYYRKN